MSVKGITISSSHIIGMDTTGIKIKLTIANSFCLCTAMTNRFFPHAHARVVRQQDFPMPHKTGNALPDVIRSPGGKRGPTYHINKYL